MLSTLCGRFPNAGSLGGKCVCSLEDLVRFHEIWWWVVLCSARSAYHGGWSQDRWSTQWAQSAGSLYLMTGPLGWRTEKIAQVDYHLRCPLCPWDTHHPCPNKPWEYWMPCSWLVSILPSNMQGISTSLLPKQVANQGTKARIPSLKVLLAPFLALALLIKLVIHDS